MSQPLFSRNFLKNKLQNFSLQDIPDLEKKREIISSWRSGILLRKEVSLDADFMNEIFGEVLGYEHHTTKSSWNLYKKLSLAGKEADGALGYFKSSPEDLSSSKSKANLFECIDVRAIIELKKPKTDLDKKQNRVDRQTPIEQAFSYANKAGEGCKWIIVSNYSEIRLYNKNIGEEKYERFLISDLGNEEKLKKFFYILQFTNLFLETQKSKIEHDLEQRQLHLQNITKEFYSHYKKVRLQLFEELRQGNKKYENQPIFLLEKTQKILDRMLFICFCEWLAIIPNGLLERVISNAENSFGGKDEKLWTEFKGLFQRMDEGFPPHDINKFNGGLFKEDKELDNLIVKDWVLQQVLDLKKYDYSNDLTVNILGHIFEQSITDYEKISSQFKSQLDLGGGKSVETEILKKKDSQRKKEGIFYTPEFITSYIVRETVGGWLEERKKELGFYELPELTDEEKDSLKLTKQNTISSTLKNSKSIIEKVKKHTSFWLNYRDKLRHIKVLDPACGSGAFLVKVFDFLKKEGEAVNKAIAELKPGQQQQEFFDLDKHILRDNIFGVDLNRASVEITQLSLWLKTADRSKELTTLDRNIQCGNSLIEDAAIAGENAFNWNERFKEVMDNGSFDVIVGNPPYLNVELLSKKDKEYFKATYKTIYKRFDIFGLFIEKGLSLTNDLGKIGLIVPSTLLNNLSYKITREEILKNKWLQTVCYTGGKVFDDATVDSTIIILDKKGNEQITLSNAVNFNSQTINTVPFDYFKKFNNNISINSNNDSNSLFEKIFSSKNKNIENDFEVFQGIVTGNNPVYIFDEEKQWKDLNIEKNLLHPLLHGRDFGKWFIRNTSRRILYVDSKTKIEEYRNANKWLTKHKEELSERRECLNGAIPWFSLQWARDKKQLDVYPKILVQNTRNESLRPRIVATIDEEGLYGSQGINFIIPKEKGNVYYLLSILNSKLIDYLFETKFMNLAIKAEYVKNIPLPNCSKDEMLFLENKAKTMLQATRSLNSISQALIQLLKSKFNLINETEKIETFFLFDYKVFLKELSKQKIKLSLSEQEEWMGYFNEKKQKAEILISEIDTATAEIDKMVYRLYNLSPEEIDIVAGKNPQAIIKAVPRPGLN